MTDDGFDAAVRFVLSQEGEWSHDPRDAGGTARYGISSRAHPDVDLKTLTPEGAIAIYKARYWDLLGLDGLPPPLALAVFDGAVQHGPGQGVRLLQSALVVPRDGVIGPQTRRAAATLSWSTILVRYLAYRQQLYHGLPGYGVFGLGWTRRLFALQARCYEIFGPRTEV